MICIGAPLPFEQSVKPILLCSQRGHLQKKSLSVSLLGQAFVATMLCSIAVPERWANSETPQANADYTTWEVTHPELRAIFGHPFTPEGRAHRARTFVPWPAQLSESALPAIQPTVVRGPQGALFVDSYSPKSWEFGMVGTSTDGGKSWSHLGTHFDMRFKVPPGSSALRVSVNGVGVTRAGSLLVHYGVQYNDGRKPAGGYEDSSYRLDEYVVRSSNRGQTWDPAIRLNATELELTGSQVCRFAQLPDGTMVLAMGSWDRSTSADTPLPLADRYARTYLYSSRDDGRSWRRAPQPVCLHGYEPDLIALPSGRLLLAIRYQRHKLPKDPPGLVSPHLLRNDQPPYTKSKTIGAGLVARFTAILHSDDAGKTWTAPRLLTGFDEQTGCLVSLSNGTVILPFGYKTDTRGQRFLISYDEGETWSRTVFQLHDDGQYASSVALADDTIVTVLHATKGLQVQALRWRAPARDVVAAGGFWSPRVVEPLGRKPVDFPNP